MAELHENYDDQSLSDYSYDDAAGGDVAHRKNIRRMLEDRLERKRLLDEFKDDFYELSADFDWSTLEDK